jgi:hypothetical protein
MQLEYTAGNSAPFGIGTYKRIVETQGGALLGWDRSMGHECRMFDEALYSAESGFTPIVREPASGTR